LSLLCTPSQTGSNSSTIYARAMDVGQQSAATLQVLLFLNPGRCHRYSYYCYITYYTLPITDRCRFSNRPIWTS